MPARLQLVATHLALAGLLGLPIAFAHAQAQPTATQARAYDIPPGPLAATLNRFAEASGIFLAAPAELTQGKTSPGLRGSYSVAEALPTLLAGTGLAAVAQSNGTYSLVPKPPTVSLPEATLPPVRVQAAAEQETATSRVTGYVARRSATGTKTDTPVIETPQSVSVVTADRIEAIGATRLKEALAYTPGVNPSPWGDESQYDWIYLRGFDAYSPGFYQDGLPLRNSGSWGIWQTENYGAERLEILRGPASVLYGQNGPGGMVNVVSKRPTAEKVREVQTQVNEHGLQMAGDFSGSLNPDSSLLYRITGLAREAELPTGALPNDRFFIAPALTWKPSADTSLTVLSQYLRMRAGSVWSSYPAVGTLLPNPNGPIPVGTSIGEADFSRYNQEQWQLGYLFEHRVNSTWTLRQNTRYGEFDTDYKTFYNGQFVVVNAGNPLDPANFRLMERTPFGSDEKAKSLVIDNQAQASFHLGGAHHTVLIGVDHQRMKMDVTAFYGGTAAPIDLYAPVYGSPVTLTATPFLNTEATYTQTGLYLQDQARIGERWVLTLGGRYDSARVGNHNRNNGTRSDQTDKAFTSRAGLVYLAPNGLAPYVSYSESFSPTTTIDPSTGTPFDPETGKQLEAGLRYQPAGSKASYSAALFHTRRQNYVSYSTAFVPQRTGEVQVRGLEFEAFVKPSAQTQLTAAYTWTPKADVTASNNLGEIGRQLNAVPRHQLSLWADHRLLPSLRLGLGARHTGSTRGSKESAPVPLPSVTLVDALLAHDAGAWNFALNARNLTGKTYVATCDGDGTSCSYGEPRRITFTATYRW